MPVRHLFPTPFYEASIDNPALVEQLTHSCLTLADDDEAGLRWSEEHGYPGYTSYASLDDLPARDPAFADLVRIVDAHVAAFAAAAHLDLGAGKLRLDSLWVNILAPGGGHTGHIHPHSAISGTVYVRVPEGSGRLKLEDPRLPMLMAAPPRTADAPEEARNFVYAAPAPGTILLWESWLRHEVEAGLDAESERISVSFNYGWR